MDFLALAKEHGTPLYAYDFDHISAQFLALKEAFSGRKSLIAYAVKANSNLSIIQHLGRLESGADCVSIGEVKRALRAGIPAYKIIFSGVGKRDSEIEEALKLDILMINVESESELLRIENIARALDKVARISIRVNPDIDPKTHPYISTGLSENKFGVSIDVAKKLYIYCAKSDFLNPVGIHFHIGSQLTELEPILESARKVADLARSLLALKIEIRFFDVGGGLGICYKDEKLINLYDYAQGILSALHGLDVTIVCEPGRFIVGNSGYFITNVLYEKRSEKKRFVIVDGAMNDLLRPSLYGAYHECIALKDGEVSEADVVGPVCESGDWLAKGVSLPILSHGDLLVFKSAGAYGFSMSSQYNSRPRVAEVAFDTEKSWLIRKRESFETLIENELSLLQVEKLK
ncbi:MAG: diaminopimelate decarboxylase [Wolinella sp.]